MPDYNSELVKKWLLQKQQDIPAVAKQTESDQAQGNPSSIEDILTLGYVKNKEDLENKKMIESGRDPYTTTPEELEQMEQLKRMKDMFQQYSIRKPIGE